MDFSEILLVSDFDLTLTDRAHGIPPANLEALDRFMAGGGLFTVGTGRAKASFMPQFHRIRVNAPCIVSNGALIYDFSTGETVLTTPMSPDEEERICALTARFCAAADMAVESGLELYRSDNVFAVAENSYTYRHYRDVGVTASLMPIDDIPRPWLKAVFTGEPDGLEAVERAAEALGLRAVRSLPYMVEIQSEKMDKGVAARWLAERMGRRLLVCAGDAPNDLAMLRCADYAYVPANAHASMLEPGFISVCDCDEGAVADVVSRLAGM